MQDNKTRPGKATKHLHYFTKRRGGVATGLMLVATMYSIGKFFIGPNGFWGHKRLMAIKQDKLHILHKLEQKNAQYALEIEKLGGGKEIDVDYLEELARSKLNYAKPDEIVIVYGEQ